MVADLVGVGLGTTPATFKSLRVFPDQTPRASVLPFEQLQSRRLRDRLTVCLRDVPDVSGLETDHPRADGLAPLRLLATTETSPRIWILGRR